MSSSTIRNIAIIAVVAAVVAIVPGGGRATSVVLAALYLAFLGATVWVASIVYRERRSTLELMGDGRRALLYGAVGVLALTLTATHRLWESPAGSIAWLALIAVSVYVAFAVFWAARRY